MKILQVNCVYRKESTGKIVLDIHEYLKKEKISSIICYGRGEKIKEKYVYKTSSEILAKYNALRSRITGFQYSGSTIATNKLIRIIKKEKPSIVHLQCINGYFVNIYKILNFLKINQIRTVLTLHAEFMHTGNCGYSYDCEKWLKNGCYDCKILKEATKSMFFDRTHTAWKKMKESFENFENLIIVSVSPWLMNRAKKSIILKGKEHRSILNGINTEETFYFKNVNYLKEMLNIADEKILLHVTSRFDSEIKGGKYIVELAKRFENKNIKIIVIGIKDKKIELPKNILNIGIIRDQKKMAEFYSLADVTILTSKRETFSMICAESLSCGTPVVGFEAGAPEQISLNNYSEFSKYGDIDLLEKNILKWLKKDIDKSSMSKEATKYYSKEQMGKLYKNLYENFDKIIENRRR